MLLDALVMSRGRQQQLLLPALEALALEAPPPGVEQVERQGMSWMGQAAGLMPG